MQTVSGRILVCVVIQIIAVAPVYAYLGPGGAVSAIGSALALVAAIVIALFGFLWFPIKRLIRSIKAKRAQAQDESVVEPRPQPPADPEEK